MVRSGRMNAYAFYQFHHTRENSLFNEEIDVNVYVGCKFAYESDNRYLIHKLHSHRRVSHMVATTKLLFLIYVLNLPTNEAQRRGTGIINAKPAALVKLSGR